jgi:hypothetical protein
MSDALDMWVRYVVFAVLVLLAVLATRAMGGSLVVGCALMIALVFLGERLFRKRE